MKKNHRLVTVLDTEDQSKVAVLRTVLDNRNIKYVMKGELLYRNRSLQILVHHEDVKTVLDILKTFDGGSDVGDEDR